MNQAEIPGLESETDVGTVSGGGTCESVYPIIVEKKE